MQSRAAPRGRGSSTRQPGPVRLSESGGEFWITDGAQEKLRSLQIHEVMRPAQHDVVLIFAQAKMHEAHLRRRAWILRVAPCRCQNAAFLFFGMGGRAKVEARQRQ